tara:strand:- start:150 stop:464 length:315 start_codon:yes stop_codon:yes gene_type:complete
MDTKNYRPLPNNLTIKPSPIEGVGLFAIATISKNTELGISHVKFKGYPSDLIRTPLGGFINHVNKDPNTIRVDTGPHFILKTIKDIEPDEEITLTYSLYDPQKK